MNINEKIENIPVPLLPTMTGILTLSNVFGGMGFEWLRHINMWLVGFFMILYIIKILRYPQKVKEEYQQVIPSSLYAGFTMTMMILSAYIAEFNHTVGQFLWLIAVILHIIHIIIFTLTHARKNYNTPQFVPSWFVTYCGLAVAAVIGGDMGFGTLQDGIAIYCVLIYLILLPFMVYRLIKKPVPEGLYHTQAIILAPVSLSLVSYLNRFPEPWFWLVTLLTVLLLISLVYYIFIVFGGFSFRFTPSFAGLTFPAAISIIATGKLVEFWEGAGYLSLASGLEQVRGIQIFITTAVVGYIALRFLMNFLNVSERMAKRYPDSQQS